LNSAPGPIVPFIRQSESNVSDNSEETTESAEFRELQESLKALDATLTKLEKKAGEEERQKQQNTTFELYPHRTRSLYVADNRIRSKDDGSVWTYTGVAEASPPVMTALTSGSNSRVVYTTTYQHSSIRSALTQSFSFTENESRTQQNIENQRSVIGPNHTISPSVQDSALMALKELTRRNPAGPAIFLGRPNAVENMPPYNFETTNSGVTIKMANSYEQLDLGSFDMAERRISMPRRQRSATDDFTRESTIPIEDHALAKPNHMRNKSGMKDFVRCISKKLQKQPAVALSKLSKPNFPTRQQSLPIMPPKIQVSEKVAKPAVHRATSDQQKKSLAMQINGSFQSSESSVEPSSKRDHTGTNQMILTHLDHQQDTRFPPVDYLAISQDTADDDSYIAREIG